MTAQAIETRYAGCRFRSRLEARWAVFFDHLGIAWEYEPQGFQIDSYPADITSNGLNLRDAYYLPDFLLRDCGTWVEVKGTEDRLDCDLLTGAAYQLPAVPYRQERGPRLLVLGPLPMPTKDGDWGWVGINPCNKVDGGQECYCGHHLPNDVTYLEYYGFGSYGKNRRPWLLLNGAEQDSWLSPTFDPYESGVPGAYAAARSARFEHGECG